MLKNVRVREAWETTDLVERSSVLLRPSAQLDSEGHSQLRELKQVLEAELL